MKNFRIFLFFLILSFSNSNVVADMPHYLDFKYILNNSTAGKKVQDTLQKRLKDGISSLNKKEKSLQEEEKKMIQQKKVISQEEYIKKVNNLRKKVGARLEKIISRKISLSFKKSIVTRLIKINCPERVILDIIGLVDMILE